MGLVGECGIVYVKFYWVVSFWIWECGGIFFGGRGFVCDFGLVGVESMVDVVGVGIVIVGVGLVGLLFVYLLL